MSAPHARADLVVPADPREPTVAGDLLAPREPVVAAEPSEPDLAAELAREERSERRLLVRQVAIVFVLVALLATHALLG
jgi:hypothetical protein